MRQPDSRDKLMTIGGLFGEFTKLAEQPVHSLSIWRASSPATLGLGRIRCSPGLGNGA
jgi:hypothetical protein